MQNNADVSVIIPAYNSARWLPQAIDSVLGQTCRVAEIIVIDDGSTDDTPAAAKQYGDAVTYIRQENSGPARARNRGISAARGAYTAFLDSDDVWFPDKIEKQMAVFRQNPEAVFVYGRILNMDSTLERELPFQVRTIYSGNIFDRLLVENFILLTSVIIKTAVLKAEGGFDETLFTSEDLNLFLRIARKYNITGLDEVIVKRRKHEHNISDRVDVPIGTLDNLDKISCLFPDTAPQIYLPMRNAYLSKGMQMMNDCFYNSNYKKCHETCVKIMKVAPPDRTVILYWFLTFFPGLLDIARGRRKR